MSNTCKYETIVDTQSKYENIALSFGKYKGQSLKEIINDEKGPGYLKWLYSEMKKNEQHSPTQRAIMLYIKSVYDL
jgi:hypothetical protein